MARQSLVLMRLFCLVMLARHSGTHKCYHSLRYRDSYDRNSIYFKFKQKDLEPLVKYLRGEWRVDITEANAQKEEWPIQCAKDVSCETFRFKNEKGDDIFAVNGCARTKVDGTECTSDGPNDLGKFLENYPGAFSSCSHCNYDECNKNWLELATPSDMKAKPNHCIHAFRHNQSYTPDQKLKDLMKNWQIFNLMREYNYECLTDYPGCQTYRCKDEFGNDKFVVNGCATQHNRLKCVYEELDPFCKPEDKRYEHCDHCFGNSCNLNKIELETLYTFQPRGTKATTRSTKATTTTDAFDNETDEPESTKGPKKTVPSTKRPRRPRASKRPTTPKPETFTDAAVAPHPFAVLAVLLPFCLSLSFRHVTVY